MRRWRCSRRLLPCLSSFYFFVVLPRNPSHADVSGKPLLLNLLCGLQCLFVCLFFSQNPGVSVFSSLSVPSRFWLGKERMNCGSVGTDGEKGEKMTASTRCLAFPKSADTQSLSSLLLFPSEYLVCGRNPCSLY